MPPHVYVTVESAVLNASSPTLFPSRAWIDGKAKDIITFLYFSFESWSSRL